MTFEAMQTLAATARRDDLALPVVVEADGGSCAVATDGNVLVAVRSDGDQIDHLRRPGRLEREMRERIEEVPENMRTVLFADLVAWAGAPTWLRPCESCDQDAIAFMPGFVRCDDCEGSGKVECVPSDTATGICEHDRKEKHTALCDGCTGTGHVACVVCDGKGTTNRPAKRYGWIRPSVLVNRELLARALACVEPTECVVLGSSNEALEPVFVLGADWRIVLMPVRPDGTDKDAPRLEVGP